jgi:hypothetical protein
VFRAGSIDALGSNLAVAMEKSGRHPLMRCRAGTARRSRKSSCSSLPRSAQKSFCHETNLTINKTRIGAIDDNCPTRKEITAGERGIRARICENVHY